MLWYFRNQTSMCIVFLYISKELIKQRLALIFQSHIYFFFKNQTLNQPYLKKEGSLDVNIFVIVIYFIYIC